MKLLSTAISSDRLVKVTLLLAIATVSVAGAVWLQVWFQKDLLEQNKKELEALQDQVDTLRKQAEATQDLAATSGQQFESSIRPWIGIKDISLNRVHCFTNQTGVRDLTEQQIRKLGQSGSDPQNLQQYISRSKCSSIDFHYDAKVRNYGSIPAEFIRIFYAPSHNSILRNVTMPDSTQLALKSYEPITLVPNQETTVRLQYTTQIENFTVLQAEESTGVFNSYPDRFVISAQYNFLDNKTHTIGVIYELDNKGIFRIIRSWVPVLQE